MVPENLMGFSGLIWSYMARYAFFDFSDIFTPSLKGPQLFTAARNL
jgi:hypothetical protein